MHQQQQGRAEAAAAAADSGAPPSAQGPFQSPQQRSQPRSRAVTQEQQRPLEQGEARGDPRTAFDRRRDGASRRVGATAAGATAAATASPGLESHNVSHGLTMRC